METTWPPPLGSSIQRQSLQEAGGGPHLPRHPLEVEVPEEELAVELVEQTHLHGRLNFEATPGQQLWALEADRSTP